LSVLGHADRLRQVLLILLDNAVKHTPPGGRVALRATHDASSTPVDTKTVMIRVSDDGPGIPLAEQERIFERFYRAPGARSGEGAGLGLAIARWIVEEHQGTISVESVPNAGATFTVRLPVLFDAPELPGPTAVPEPALALAPFAP
jgi:two-component system OmpR family sensor kinase